MRTGAGAVLAVAVSLAMVSVPAGADFHGDCTGQFTAYANTNLTYVEDEQALRYEGLVNCPDAEVVIEHVQLTRIVPDHEPLANTSAEPCQATLTDPCTAGELADVEPMPGEYEVNMTFSTPNYEDVERLQRWTWTGEGQPVPVCVHAGVFPVSAGECPDGSQG